MRPSLLFGSASVSPALQRPAVAAAAAAAAVMRGISRVLAELALPHSSVDLDQPKNKHHQ